MDTANVLALELDLPSAPSAAARLVARGDTCLIYLPSVNGRRFVAMAGVGFDAHVVAAVTPGLKRRLGKLAYVWKTLTGLGRFSRTHYAVGVDGESFSAASVVVANGRYYAGRYPVAPAARLDEPDLHVCLFERAGAWNAVRYAVGLVLGRLSRMPDVRVVTGRSIHIAGEASEPVQVDGDIVGRLPVQIEAASGRVRVICPAVRR